MNETKFVKMLVKSNIPHSYGRDIDYHKNLVPEMNNYIQVSNPSGIGYTGNFSLWFFDGDGKLLKVGHYE